VALPVEVARVEHFADRPDRTWGEHHRAEDGLLGIEILRWDRGGLRRLDDCGHVGISAGWKRQFQRLENLLRRSVPETKRGLLAGLGNARSPDFPQPVGRRPQLAEQILRPNFAL
jgi:hypothetical protein